MLAFWGLAGLLSILAVLILLIPLLRGGRTETANRAALNRALYRERLAEVQARVDRGELDAQAVELAEAEAVRSLLADSAVVERAPARRGRRLGIAVAFMV
ncbi:cytochrome C biogenesis protein, partial [Pseudomonas oryzihabitans]